jgi:DNA-binding MarR family transcriptional regulator
VDAGNPFDQAQLDDVVHGRVRLGIVAYLSSVESALFPELRDKVGATDGNLSAHLRKLEDAGYVEVEKSFAGRKPQTRLQLTATGRRAWQSWLRQMESLMGAAGAAEKRR